MIPNRCENPQLTLRDQDFKTQLVRRMTDDFTVRARQTATGFLAASKVSGHLNTDHFVGVNKMVNLGYGNRRCKRLCHYAYDLKCISMPISRRTAVRGYRTLPCQAHNTRLAATQIAFKCMLPTTLSPENDLRQVERRRQDKPSTPRKASQ